MPLIEPGVYEEVVVQTIGTGATTRKHEMKNYYLAASLDKNTVQVQPLDMFDQPMAIFEKIEVREFLRRCTFKPNYLAEKQKQKDPRVDKAVVQAEAHFRRKEYYSAEFEYTKALKLDVENVRANFGMGKVYLATGETEKAKESFEKLSRIEAIFEEEHKHVFNELGIELRRLKLYDQAITYYLKALTISQDDENLFFNAARAYFEKGDIKNAGQYLCQALQINPDLQEGLKLLSAIEKIDG
ncbi:MAG: tetratricopeptide repeat protein [Deltaproteobacteria bacterium]|nr:tetratricopeptide repeat protein [Deltaproteobacteria bacterium]